MEAWHTDTDTDTDVDADADTGNRIITCRRRESISLVG